MSGAHTRSCRPQVELKTRTYLLFQIAWPYLSNSPSRARSVEQRKRWISDIQAAHAAVAPAAAAAISQSLAKQNAEFAALDSGSKAREPIGVIKIKYVPMFDAGLHAMFIDFVAQSKTAPRQKLATSASVPVMDACCFDPSNGYYFYSYTRFLLLA
jgi:hypothetical protein